MADQLAIPLDNSIDRYQGDDPIAERGAPALVDGGLVDGLGRLDGRRLAVSVAIGLALALGACGGGEPPTTTMGVPDPEATEPESPDPLPQDAEMPELVGLQEHQAIELLESAGIADYRLDEQGSLRPSGEILEQLPSAGSAIRGPVTLTIAVALPPMPDYVGTRVGDARSDLEAWGVVVTEESELNLDRPSGEVIGSVPPAGEQIGTEVVLHVAVAPVIGALGVEAAEVATRAFGAIQDGSIEIDGELYENSIYAYGHARPGDLAHWEYNLGRDWEFFETVVGLVDTSEFEQNGRFRVVLDGSVIWEKDVKFGNSEVVSINVSDGLRLRLEAVALGEGYIGLGWGGPRLLGIPGEAPVGNQSPEDE